MRSSQWPGGDIRTEDTAVQHRKEECLRQIREDDVGHLLRAGVEERVAFVLYGCVKLPITIFPHLKSER